MRARTVFAATVSAVLMLGACSTLGISRSDYVVTSANMDAITLRFDEGNLNVAQARAEAHCDDYQRDARLFNLTSANRQSVAEFRCETPSNFG